MVPQSWSYPASPAVKETLETAEIVVDQPNTAYGDNPYTVQTGGCGEEGRFIHVTPWFVVNHEGGARELFGEAGKALVHEWAKLRWGVFEEYGYPGDDKFPLFYYKTTWTEEGQQNVLRPNFCTDTELLGYGVDMVTGEGCRYVSTELLAALYSCFSKDATCIMRIMQTLAEIA